MVLEPREPIKATLDGLLRNLNDTVKVGGHFVGCCFDGHTVDLMLRDLPKGGIKRGTEDAYDIWTIAKKYEEPLVDSDAGLGRAIDVGFISIGELYTEYLVSYPYLVSRLAEIGLEPLNADELGVLGLHNSTNMFGDSYAMAAASGRAFPMSPVVRQFSFLNRWFIFKRRHANASSVSAAAVVLPLLPTGSSAPAASLPGTGAPTLAIEDDEAVIVPAGAAEVAGAAEEAEAEAGANVELTLADGPAYQFYHKSAPKDELKIGNKNWRRVLSTYAPFAFKDPSNAAIVYPSLEAALGSAKFAVASNKPELGPSLFSEAGTIHQRFVARKQDATGGKRALSAEEATMFIEEEGNAYRDAQKAAGFRKVGATFNEEAWAATEERVLSEFLRQRFEGDAAFRGILAAVNSVRARLVYYTAGSSTSMMRREHVAKI
jgi:hypothetical protein